MKKITAILLLSLFFIAQVGYYFIYSHHQYSSKKEAKRRLLSGIPDSSLEIIELTDVIHWEEKGKEFYLNGELYDIIKVKKDKGKIWLYCLNDHKEKQILKKLSKAAKSTTNSPGGKNNKQSIKFQCRIYSSLTFCLLNISGEISKRNSLGLDPSLITSYKEVNVPPPRA